MSEELGGANLSWFLLYGEDIRDRLDPNKPEDSAAITAQRKQVEQDWQVLMHGPGKAIFKMLERKMKTMNISLFGISTDLLCPCKACLIIREMQSILRLWETAEGAVNEKP